ncbi:unnamed protein product [Adineta steineri]|uniref:Uncharacterized protein n=3 Tax=Adineta steineri TaxID=433720 RepID=A0A819KU04_9BILA|nr:unnamed protein product [Adineta steineri]
MEKKNTIHPESVNSDIGETQPTQLTRPRVCIRSKLMWIIFTIVIIAIIIIPTTIILTKKGNIVETNLTTIMTTTTAEPESTTTKETAGYLMKKHQSCIVSCFLLV